MKVFVTDAGFKNALCAIRSLGRHGCEVLAGSPRAWAQGFYSRYCNEHVVCPNPGDAEKFVDFLVELTNRRGVDVILPIGDQSVTALSRFRNRFDRRVAIPIADWEKMHIAASKAATVALATGLGVAVPRTYASVDEVDRFPVVVKGGTGSGEVRYVNSRAELRERVRPGMLIQEYVRGEGRALFALYDHGTVRAEFAHRRVREFPVTGGASTAAESFRDPELTALGLRLLDALGWHGVAMVEFKWNAGRYTLMEINPKFWGSLDLAIAAGVDFPWLAVQLARGEPLGAVLEYPIGVRFQWIFDDLLHVAARPQSAGAVLADLMRRRVQSDVWLRDLKPNLVRGATALGTLVIRLARRTLRYPHGIPRVDGR